MPLPLAGRAQCGACGDARLPIPPQRPVYEVALNLPFVRSPKARDLKMIQGSRKRLQSKIFREKEPQRSSHALTACGKGSMRSLRRRASANSTTAAFLCSYVESPLCSFPQSKGLKMIQGSRKRLQSKIFREKEPQRSSHALTACGKGSMRSLRRRASANSTTAAFLCSYVGSPLCSFPQSKGLKNDTGLPKKIARQDFREKEPQRGSATSQRLRALRAKAGLPRAYCRILIAASCRILRGRAWGIFPRGDCGGNKRASNPMPFVWRRHPDLNRGVRVLQTLALPLGYGAKKNSAEALCLERETRFEPATSTLARWRSTTELFPHMSFPHCIGGSYRDRTYDPLLVRQVLSRLS